MVRMIILIRLAVLGAGLAVVPALAAKQKPPSGALQVDAINTAQWSAGSTEGKLNPLVLKAQVLLKRAGFSPGVVDGRSGDNFHKALRAYQREAGLQATGKLDEATWNKLVQGSPTQVVVRPYTVSANDAKGPFLKRIPEQFDLMAELEWVGYRSPRELLAEKFHMSEELLSALNKGTSLENEGATVVVADVEPLQVSNTKRHSTGDRKNQNSDKRRGIRVQADKGDRSVRVFGEDGKLIAYYPASIGSTEKPAPAGTFEVRGIAIYPTYQYDPAYAFKGQRAKEKVKIAPGPNNPVGIVWIDLSAESYGIHGTPEPGKVSKTQSNGCIRLTNWDAVALVRLVNKGTSVEFLN
jgi:lipoprotein-anchoring transpeptidase ErfK/SrfK